MEVNYNKEETLRLIEEYYKRLESREVKANIETSSGPVGLYEETGCITTISVKEKMEIGGVMKEVVIRLSKEELKKMLIALFELYGFKLTSVDINDGISSGWEGYGMMEHKVSKSYFKGITLQVEKKIEKKLAKV